MLESKESGQSSKRKTRTGMSIDHHHPQNGLYLYHDFCFSMSHIDNRQCFDFFLGNHHPGNRLFHYVLHSLGHNGLHRDHRNLHFYCTDPHPCSPTLSLYHSHIHPCSHIGLHSDHHHIYHLHLMAYTFHQMMTRFGTCFETKKSNHKFLTTGRHSTACRLSYKQTKLFVHRRGDTSYFKHKKSTRKPSIQFGTLLCLIHGLRRRSGLECIL